MYIILHLKQNKEGDEGNYWKRSVIYFPSNFREETLEL